VPREEAQQNRFADLIRLDSSVVTFGASTAVARAVTSTALVTSVADFPPGDGQAFAAVTMKSELEKFPRPRPLHHALPSISRGFHMVTRFLNIFLFAQLNLETDALFASNRRKLARFFDTNQFDSGDSMLERKAIDPLFDFFYASRRRRL
jgi:hypothetical protein